MSREARAFTWCALTSDHPLPLLDRRRIIGERMMIAEIRLRKGCKVESHSHQNEQIAVILSGKLKFVVGKSDGSSEELILTAGQVLHLPSNVPHSAEAVEETLVLDVFSPPTETTGLDQMSPGGDESS